MNKKSVVILIIYIICITIINYYIYLDKLQALELTLLDILVFMGIINIFILVLPICIYFSIIINRYLEEKNKLLLFILKQEISNSEYKEKKLLKKISKLERQLKKNK